MREKPVAEGPTAIPAPSNALVWRKPLIYAGNNCGECALIEMTEKTKFSDRQCVLSKGSIR